MTHRWRRRVNERLRKFKREFLPGGLEGASIEEETFFQEHDAEEV